MFWLMLLSLPPALLKDCSYVNSPAAGHRVVLMLAVGDIYNEKVDAAKLSLNVLQDVEVPAIDKKKYVPWVNDQDIW